MTRSDATVEPSDVADEDGTQEKSGARGGVAPPPAGHRSAIAHKLITFIGITLVIGSLHALLAIAAYSVQPWQLVLLPFLRLVYLRNSGLGFGLVQSESLLVAGLNIVGLIVVSITSAILSALVKARYPLQYFAIHVAIVSAWLLSCERLLFGATTHYFLFTIDGWALPVGSLPGVLFQVIAFLAYPFALIKFFRLRTAPLDDGTAPGDVADPYLEMRRPLKGLLVVIAIALLLPLASGAVTDVVIASRAGQMDLVYGIVTILIGFIVPSGIIAMLIWFLWRLIPDRAVDVVFLRAFQDDRAATRTLKSLRRALGSSIRLTGVTDPKDLPRLVYLPLYLYFPFFFVLGDFARANAFRHTVFLVGHWKDGVRSILNVVPVAVFECGNITKSLAWELEQAVKEIGPAAIVLIHPEDVNRENIARTFIGQGVDPAALESIRGSQWFVRSKTELAARHIAAQLPRLRDEGRRATTRA
jgi:hypothetical protein